MHMKRILCCIVAILTTVAVFAQNEEKARWSPEFSIKAFAGVYHGSYDFTAGARINDNVFGLGSGYATMHMDAYPADVRKIPVYAFYRRYSPLGQKRRFLLFGEVTLGGECIYKYTGNTTGRFAESHQTPPYWQWRVSFTPGIALRLFGNTSIYIAPTLEVFGIQDLHGGITAGVNVGL